MATKHSCLLSQLFASALLLSGCGSGGGSKTMPTDATAGTGGATSGPTDTQAEAGGSSACINNADDLIADFTSDNSLNPVDGRSGGFYVYGDNSLAGQFDPPLVNDQPYPIDTTTGNKCSGPGSFHTHATGWGVWGAALGADFMPRMSLDAGMAYDGNGFKQTYDASKYKGISFWAKAAAPISGVQVSFPDIYTDGAASPSTIDPSTSSCVYTAGASNCSPYLVKLGSSSFSNYQDDQIDTTWRRFDIFFADTQQDQYNPGFVPPGKQLSVKYLTSMAIQVNAIHTASSVTSNDFEIWVDDVNFIE